MSDAVAYLVGGLALVAVIARALLRERKEVDIHVSQTWLNQDKQRRRDHDRG